MDAFLKLVLYKYRGSQSLSSTLEYILHYVDIVKYYQDLGIGTGFIKLIDDLSKTANGDSKTQIDIILN